jgi:hypothetical protein
MSHPRSLGIAVLLGLFAAGAAPAQSAQLPETPAGRQAAALLRTLRDGGEPAVRAFVAEAMNEEFRQIPMDQHLDMFRRMADDFGRAPIRAVDAPSPERVRVTFDGGGGPVVVDLSVEAAPPHRISSLDISAGGPREGGGRRVEAGPAPTSLDDAARAAAVDSAASLLTRQYIDADTGRLIADHLRARLAAGAYAGLSDPAAFVEALTSDLRAVNGDRHLRARIGTPDLSGPARIATGGDYRFLDRVEVLDGNVGYLKLSMIPAAREAFDEVERALRSLERTEAMVIDLRGSRGGSAQMANFLISHFTRPGLLSLAVASRGRADTVWRRTLEAVPGPRRTEVPLFVLIDSVAGSASEDIPFVLRNLGRATLIGQTTGGAGRNNRFFALNDGMMLSVSVTRVWDPCTGREWERVGVAPDVAVPPAQALEVALRSARDARYRPAAEVPQASCRVRA